MNPVDPNWIQAQHRCFLNWTNSQLANRNVKLTNLTEDLKSGVHLLELLSELLQKSIPIPTLNPQFRIQMMNNLTEAFQVIRNDCDISLINIDSNDIVDGNTKLILALIHSLMYKYQVCKAMSDEKIQIDSKHTPMKIVEKQLIDWLNEILYESRPIIGNLSSDWMDGEHLQKLVGYFLYPNDSNTMLESSAMNPVEKIGESMRLAEQELKIPKILEAQDVANGPDPFSMLAYLSYFRMVNKKQKESSSIPTAVVVPPPTPQPTTQTVVQPIVVQEIPKPLFETVKQQPTTVSSINFNEDISSAPPLSPPPLSPPEQQFSYQQQPPQPTTTNMRNLHHTDHYHHHQQEPPIHYQHKPQNSQFRPCSSLTTSTYLPTSSGSCDQSTTTGTANHISSLYSPSNSGGGVVQPIPGIPTMNSNHHNMNQLMVPPQPSMMQIQPYMVDPYGNHQHYSMQSYQQQHQQQPMMMMHQQYTSSPIVSPQISPMVITTTTTTNNPVFTTDNMQYGYYQQHF